jgi:hypothetical protein
VLLDPRQQLLVVPRDEDDSAGTGEHLSHVSTLRSAWTGVTLKLRHSSRPRQLGLGRATVAEHVAAAADKLGARNRAQAAALASLASG